MWPGQLGLVEVVNAVNGRKQNGKEAQAAQSHVTRCNVIYILTFGEVERDLWASRYRSKGGGASTKKSLCKWKVE